MRAKAEIIEGLEHCVDRDCIGCPYFAEGGDCQAIMRRDALALIHKQGAEIAELTAHELRTLRGQARAGDEVGALKGLCKLIRRRGAKDGTGT